MEVYFTQDGWEDYGFWYKHDKRCKWRSNTAPVDGGAEAVVQKHKMAE